MRLSILFVSLFLLFPITRIHAQDIEQQRLALKEIRDTANDMCTRTPLETESQNVELSGDAKAKLAGVIVKVADLGIEGAAKYNQGKSKNVLQKDLANAIKSGDDCRLTVFNTLVDRMIPKRGSDAKRTLPVKFNKPSGYFLKEGKIWTEFPSYAPGRHFRFEDAGTDKEYIYMADNSRTKPGEPNNGMLVRLPIQGGSAQWSYQNPMIWSEFTVVNPSY